MTSRSPSSSAVTAGSKEVKPPIPIFWLAAAAVLLAATLVLLQFVLPVFAAMFADFGSELPALTRGYLHLSDEFRRFWWGAKLLVAGMVIIRLARRGWPIPSRRVLKWSAFALLLFLVVALVAMALPIFELGRVAAAIQ